MFSHGLKRSSPASVRMPRARSLAEGLPSLSIQILKNVPTPLRMPALGAPRPFARLLYLVKEEFV